MRSEGGETGPHPEFLTRRGDCGVGAIAAGCWGVVSTAELLSCGLSHNAIATRCHAGRLYRLHRGVYAVGHPNPPWQGRLLAAAKASGSDAVASHFSAAALWGLIDFDPERLPEVIVGRTRGGRHANIRAHRATNLSPRDRSRTQLVPVTAPARTLLDLAVTLDDRSLRSLVRRAQGLKRVNLRQLSEVVTRLGPCRGSRRLAQVIATGPAPTNSVLEDIVLDLLIEGGFVHPEVNKPLRIDGRRIIPDFRWPREHLILEADGAAWHDGKVAREDDAERQALLEAAGERVVRVTWGQAVSQRARTLARIRAAGAPTSHQGRVAGAQPQ